MFDSVSGLVTPLPVKVSQVGHRVTCDTWAEVPDRYVRAYAISYALSYAVTVMLDRPGGFEYPPAGVAFELAPDRAIHRA
jgi:hypothetical protein